MKKNYCYYNNNNKISVGLYWFKIIVSCFNHNYFFYQYKKNHKKEIIEKYRENYWNKYIKRYVDELKEEVSKEFNKKDEDEYKYNNFFMSKKEWIKLIYLNNAIFPLKGRDINLAELI